MPTPQGKYWCWTLNNPTEEDIENLQVLQILHPKVEFLCFQLEEGESKTPHLQGYIEFNTRVTLKQAKLIVSERCHIERRKGTADQARAYCIKEDGRLDGPWEYGVCTGPPESRGRRTDLEAIRAALKSGTSEREIADAYFSQWLQYNVSFRRYRGLCFNHRDWKTKTIVIVGPPGTGKSKYIMDNYPTAYWKQRSQWWDLYEGHDTVVLDDFYGWLPYDVLLRIADRYPLYVETKGGQAVFLARTLVITSNNTPAQWYKNVVLAAFTRRVDRWMFMGKDVTVDTEDYDVFCNAITRNFINQ